MVEKTVTRTAADQMKNSNGETHQNLYACAGEVSRSRTAWIMTAERAAVGIQKKAGVRPYKETMTIMPLSMPAAGVRTPDLALSAEREKEPVAG